MQNDNQQFLSERKEKEEDIVKQLIQLRSISRIEYVDIGWTSRVYIVDHGKYIAKLPRSDATRKEYIQEIAALKLLENIKSKARAPRVYLTQKNNDYVIYKGIVGD